MSIDMTEGLKEFELNEAQDKLLLFFGSVCRSILAGRWAFSVNEVIDQTMSDTSILLSVSYPD